MACNKATGYAKGMLLADHPELFQGWELDPASDSQILVEPASDSFRQGDSASESIDGQSSGLEKSHMTLEVKQEEEDSWKKATMPRSSMKLDFLGYSTASGAATPTLLAV